MPTQLINAEALIDDIYERVDGDWQKDFVEIVEVQPTVDAIPMGALERVAELYSELGDAAKTIPVVGKAVPPTQIPLDPSTIVVDKVIKMEARDPKTGEVLWVWEPIEEQDE